MLPCITAVLQGTTWATVRKGRKKRHTVLRTALLFTPSLLACCLWGSLAGARTNLYTAISTELTTAYLCHGALPIPVTLQWHQSYMSMLLQPQSGACSKSIPLAPPHLGLPHGPCELAGHTVSVTHCGAIVGAEATLSFLPPELQLVGVGQLGPARVAEALLLAGPVLGDVDRHPRGPGGVPAHLWAALRVAGLVFLPRRKTAPSLLTKQQQPNWQRLIYTSENNGGTLWISNNLHPPYLTSQEQNVVIMEAMCYIGGPQE